MNNSPIIRFWKLLKLYKIQLRQIYAYAVLNGFVNLSLPLGIQAIISYIQLGEITSSWVVLVGVVLVGTAIAGIFQILQLRIVENIQQDIFARSSFEFAYRLPKIKFLQLDTVHAPELANRFFDTLTIQKGLPKILIDFSLAAFQIVFGLIVLTIYSSYFIILGAGLLFILWLIFKITGPDGLTTSIKESKYKYKLAHWLEEIARVNRSFKLNAASKFHLDRTDDITAHYLYAREKHFHVLLNQFRFFIFFKVVVAAGLLLLGGYLVFKNQMNIGQFVAAEIIILLIINSVEKVIRVIDTIYDVLTALDKIGHVTDLPLDGDSGKLLLEKTGAMSVTATDIRFGFPGVRKKVIDNLSFRINAKEKVVVKGESGAGKSILLQVLAGIYNLEDGEILFNDIPFANYNRDEFYKKIGVVFPSNQLFEGTIKENITMGRMIDEKEFRAVVELLDLTDYIIHLPDGFDSFVDSGGRRLPRSVIQKLHLARIIVGNPSLILMEDPLQFLEDKEKNRIIDYMMSPERDWTVIVVADYNYWQKKSTKTIQLS